MPKPLVDIPSLRMNLVPKREPRTQRAKRPPNFTREKGKTLIASSSHSFHEKKNNAYLYSHVKNVSHDARNVHHDASIDHPVLHMCHDVVFLLTL